MPVSSSGPPHRALASSRRAALLDLLCAHDDALSVAELASAVGRHANTVRAHLEVLVRSGHVERRTDARGTPGRPREVYRATGAPIGDRSYQLLAELLTHHLSASSKDPGGAAQEAGRSWAQVSGPSTAAVPSVSPPPGSPREALAPVLRMLSAAGFAPELTADASAIGLRHCPFRELAAQHPEIVCRAHLGLIQGMLAHVGAPLGATQILPFVSPELCVAILGPAGAQ